LIVWNDPSEFNINDDFFWNFKVVFERVKIIIAEIFRMIF